MFSSTPPGTPAPISLLNPFGGLNTTTDLLCYSADEVQAEKRTLYFLMTLGFFHSAGFSISTMCFLSMAIVMKSSRLLRSPIFFLLLTAITCGAISTLLAVVSHQRHLLGNPDLLKTFFSTDLMTAALVLVGLVPILADSTLVFRIMLFYRLDERPDLRKGLCVITLPVLLKAGRLALQIVTRIDWLHFQRTGRMICPEAWRYGWILNAVDPAICTAFICYKLHRMSLRASTTGKKGNKSRINRFLRTALWTSAAAVVIPIALAIAMIALLFTNNGSIATRTYIVHLHGWSSIVAACFSSFWPEIQSSYYKKGDTTAPRFVIGFDVDLHRDLNRDVNGPDTGLLAHSPSLRRPSNCGDSKRAFDATWSGEEIFLPIFDFKEGVGAKQFTRTRIYDDDGRKERLQSMGVTSSAQTRHISTWAYPSKEAVYRPMRLRQVNNSTGECLTASTFDEGPFSASISYPSKESGTTHRGRPDVLRRSRSIGSVREHFTVDLPLGGPERKSSDSSFEDFSHYQGLPLSANTDMSSTPPSSIDSVARQDRNQSGHIENQRGSPQSGSDGDSVHSAPLPTRQCGVSRRSQQRPCERSEVGHPLNKARLTRPQLTRGLSESAVVRPSTIHDPECVTQSSNRQCSAPAQGSFSRSHPYVRSFSTIKGHETSDHHGRAADSTTSRQSPARESVRFALDGSKSSCAVHGRQPRPLEGGTAIVRSHSLSYHKKVHHHHHQQYREHLEERPHVPRFLPLQEKRDVEDFDGQPTETLAGQAIDMRTTTTATPESLSNFTIIQPMLSALPSLFRRRSEVTRTQRSLRIGQTNRDRDETSSVAEQKEVSGSASATLTLRNDRGRAQMRCPDAILSLPPTSTPTLDRRGQIQSHKTAGIEGQFTPATAHHLKREDGGGRRRRRSTFSTFVGLGSVASASGEPRAGNNKIHNSSSGSGTEFPFAGRNRIGTNPQSPRSQHSPTSSQSMSGAGGGGVSSIRLFTETCVRVE